MYRDGKSEVDQTHLWDYADWSLYRQPVHHSVMSATPSSQLTPLGNAERKAPRPPASSSKGEPVGTNERVVAAPFGSGTFSGL
jgi:hypothetical protein